MVNIVITTCLLALFLHDAYTLEDVHRKIIENNIIDNARECFLDNKISATHLIALRDFKTPSDVKVFCFLECVFKRLRLINESGKVTPQEAMDVAAALINDDSILNGIKELLTHCSSTPEKASGETACEGSRHLHQCLVENREKYDLTIKFKTN